MQLCLPPAVPPVACRADEQQQQQQQPPSEERSNRLLQQLQGYDYDPAAQPPEIEEPYPDDSVSQIDYDDDHYAGEACVGTSNPQPWSMLLSVPWESILLRVVPLASAVSVNGP